MLISLVVLTFGLPLPQRQLLSSKRLEKLFPAAGRSQLVASGSHASSSNPSRETSAAVASGSGASSTSRSLKKPPLAEEMEGEDLGAKSDSGSSDSDDVSPTVDSKDPKMSTQRVKQLRERFAVNKDLHTSILWNKMDGKQDANRLVDQGQTPARWSAASILRDENCKPVSQSRLSRIRNFARNATIELYNKTIAIRVHTSGPYGQRYMDRFHSDLLEELYESICAEYYEVQLCNDMWKAKHLVSYEIVSLATFNSPPT